MRIARGLKITAFDIRYVEEVVIPLYGIVVDLQIACHLDQVFRTTAVNFRRVEISRLTHFCARSGTAGRLLHRSGGLPVDQAAADRRRPVCRDSSCASPAQARPLRGRCTPTPRLRAGRHRPHHGETPGVVVEAPQRALLPRRNTTPVFGFGKFGKQIGAGTSKLVAPSVCTVITSGNSSSSGNCPGIRSGGTGAMPTWPPGVPSSL